MEQAEVTPMAENIVDVTLERIEKIMQSLDGVKLSRGDRNRLITATGEIQSLLIDSCPPGD